MLWDMRALAWLISVFWLSSMVDSRADRPAPALPPLAASPPEVRAETTERVLLVVLDGARWQDVYGDPALMPTLHQWMAEGVALGAPGVGEPIEASGPNFVSLPGYTELLTGRTSSCGTNECGPSSEPTVMDEARNTGSVAVVSSWESIANVVAHLGSSSFVSCGRRPALGAYDAATQRLLADGARANPWPGQAEFRPDRLTAELALHVLESRGPRLMFLGLGETDEYAHHGDRQGYLAALRFDDEVLARIDATLRRTGADQHTTVLVTADHGRARGFREHGRAWPESSRVWLVAKGGSVPARGYTASSAPRRLADVAPSIRQLLGLPAVQGTGAGTPLDELRVR
jgi:hypothetical protein